MAIWLITSKEWQSTATPTYIAGSVTQFEYSIITWHQIVSNKTINQQELTCEEYYKTLTALSMLLESCHTTAIAYELQNTIPWEFSLQIHAILNWGVITGKQLATLLKAANQKVFVFKGLHLGRNCLCRIGQSSLFCSMLTAAMNNQQRLFLTASVDAFINCLFMFSKSGKEIKSQVTGLSR